jgi:hypothetical protein
VVVLWVWVGVVVLTLVVLGGLVYGLLGAFRRLSREVQALDRDLRPVLGQAQQALARAAEVNARRGGDV